MIGRDEDLRGRARAQQHQRAREQLHAALEAGGVDPPLPDEPPDEPLPVELPDAGAAAVDVEAVDEEEDDEDELDYEAPPPPLPSFFDE